jgi:3D (Asp-Asp-Asp) domain-containing protein
MRLLTIIGILFAFSIIYIGIREVVIGIELDRAVSQANGSAAHPTYVVNLTPPTPPVEDTEDTTYLGHSGHWVTVRATGYSPLDVDKPTFQTALGVDCHAQPYGIAVPSRKRKTTIFPFNTRFIVPLETRYALDAQTRVFIADDTGGVITTKTEEYSVPYVDFRFKTPKEAIEWAGPLGYQTIRLFVIEDPPDAAIDRPR